MRAAVFSSTGPATTVLSVREIERVEPGPGEVCVRIATSGVNPSDVKRRAAAPAGSPAEFAIVIPHSDGAGVIEGVGSGVDAARIGERVWLYNAQWQRAFGSAAEWCTLPATQAIRLPDAIDFAIGASLGIPALTAYHAVMLDGDIAGETLLIMGGAGAVGHAAIAIAKSAGARVITTVSSEAKAASAKAAGADEVINYRTEDVALRVHDLTSGALVDRVIEVDVAANARLYGNVLREYGKAVIYGSSKPEATIPAAFIRRSTTLQFFIVYQLRAHDMHAAIDGVTQLLVNKKLVPVIAATFPLDRIAAAHELVESGQALGNVVVTIAANGPG